MPTLKLALDSETYSRLVEQAVSERRPIGWQAEVALRRALGLLVPSDCVSSASVDQSAVDDARPIQP